MKHNEELDRLRELHRQKSLQEQDKARAEMEKLKQQLYEKDLQCKKLIKQHQDDIESYKQRIIALEHELDDTLKKNSILVSTNEQLT